MQPCACAGGDKGPPSPVGSEPGVADNAQDNVIEEVRDLFASDTLEEV